MKTNRRQLLRGTAVAGAALALGETGAAFAQTPVATPGATPVATGSIDELRIAMQALSPQLDPQNVFGIVSFRMYPMVFDTLLSRDWSQNGKIAPSLATAWTQVDDVTIEMNLRTDVLFHDGTPFTAADVVFTFERTLDKSVSLTASNYFPITKVVAVDDHTVRFTTNGPSGAFPFLLTQVGYGSIVPAAYFQKVGADTFGLAPIGTGTHKLTEYVPDSHITLVVNEHYWGGVSAAKKVTVSSIPEVSTRIASLLNGEVDIILDLPPDQVPTVQKGGDFTVTSVAPLNTQILPIVGTNAPMDKKEIRQALSLAIDRDTIVKQLLLGKGVWPSSIQGESDPLYTKRPQLAYDPDKAKALLAQAGYAGEEIQFAFDSPDYYPLEQTWSEAIAGMWQAVGLNVKMIGIDVSQRVLIDTTSPYHIFTSGSGVVMDALMPQSFSTPESAGEKLFPAEDFTQVNALVAEAKQTIDNDSRAELYSRVIDILNDLTPEVVLFIVDRVSAMQPKVTWSEHPDFTIDLRPGSLSVAS